MMTRGPFYRIAHERTGVGPYQDPTFAMSPLYDHNYSSEHPVSARNWSYAHQHGFRSMAQMCRWFNRAERQWLREHGYVLKVGRAVYDWHDSYQVAARHTDVTIQVVGRIP